MDTWAAHSNSAVISSAPWKRRGEELFSDSQYITKFLGIHIPLSEGFEGVHSSEMKDKVLAEQMLFESWIVGLRTAIKRGIDKTGAAAATVDSFIEAVSRSVSKSSGLLFLQTWIDAVKEKVFAPLRSQIEALVKKWFPEQDIKTTLKGTIKSGVNWFKEKIVNGIDRLIAKTGGWRQFFLLIAGIVGFTAILDKLSMVAGLSLSKKAAAGTAVAKIRTTISGNVTNITSGIVAFGKDQGKFMEFLGWLSGTFGAVYSIGKIITLLKPATDATLRMKTKDLVQQGAQDPNAERKAAVDATKAKFLSDLARMNLTEARAMTLFKESALKYYLQRSITSLLFGPNQKKLSSQIKSAWAFQQFETLIPTTSGKEAAFLARLEHIQQTWPNKSEEAASISSSCEKSYSLGVFHAGGQYATGLKTSGAVSMIYNRVSKMEAQFVDTAGGSFQVDPRALTLLLWNQYRTDNRLSISLSDPQLEARLSNPESNRAVLRLQQNLKKTLAGSRATLAKTTRRRTRSMREGPDDLWQKFKKNIKTS